MLRTTGPLFRIQYSVRVGLALESRHEGLTSWCGMSRRILDRRMQPVRRDTRSH